MAFRCLMHPPSAFCDPVIRQGFDPYASTTQSRDLRVIESSINPKYRAKNDTLELNADYQAGPSLTFTSQTGYNNDFYGPPKTITASIPHPEFSSIFRRTCLGGKA